MDISKWPLDRIMQLPDWCFGRRWWVGKYVGTQADDPNLFIIEESVPDIFILWDVLIASAGHTGGTHTNVTFRLCAEVPTTANIKTFRRLMRNMSSREQMYDIHLPPVSTTHLGPMRTLINAGNDKIGGAFKIVAETADCENTVACLISGIPKDVPDFLR